MLLTEKQLFENFSHILINVRMPKFGRALYITMPKNIDNTTTSLKIEKTSEKLKSDVLYKLSVIE